MDSAKINDKTFPEVFKPDAFIESVKKGEMNRQIQSTNDLQTPTTKLFIEALTSKDFNTEKQADEKYQHRQRMPKQVCIH